MDITYDRERKAKIAVLEPGGYLLFGQSKLEQFRLLDEADLKGRRQHFLASTEVDGRTVEAEIYPLKRLPLIGIRLQKAGDWSMEDTWARTVFGKPFDELDEADRTAVQTSLSESERLASNREDEAKPGRGERPRRNRDPQPESEESFESDDSATGDAEGQTGNADADSNTNSPAELEPAGKDGY